jgi:hypothetical protein
MDDRLHSDTHLKKRRGRPPGKNKGKTEQQNLGRQNGWTKPTTKGQAQDTQLKQTEVEPPSTRQNSTATENIFGDFLQSILRHDRGEIARAAKALNVAENTIYRWMNGTSVPRVIYLKRLPDIFPEQRVQLITIINEVFGDVLGAPTPVLDEIGKDLYMKVLELATNSYDKEARMWQVSQAIFEYALLHMDSEHLGMAITYARLTQPHADGIHSLYETMMCGNDPWPTSIESATFLGSTSLAGNAATTLRVQVWSDTDDSRSLVEIDEFEHSACAAPILRDGLLAGVLIFSSAQSDFFRDPQTVQAVTEYALLMGVALGDSEFHPSSLLNLRPMPDLKWQRKQIIETYANRVIIYARRYATARREAERQVQQEMELEFEEEARKMLQQRQKDVEQVQTVARQPPNTAFQK